MNSPTFMIFCLCKPFWFFCFCLSSLKDVPKNGPISWFMLGIRIAQASIGTQRMETGKQATGSNPWDQWAIIGDSHQSHIGDPHSR